MIVLSMPVVGPLLVSAPVGEGEAHAAGPGAPTTRPIRDFWSPKDGHNDVSEYESLINISLNAVFP